MEPLPILRYQGTKTERHITLPETIFGITPNEHAVWLDVKHFLANQRQGTAKTKEKSEVNASTKKIQRQKGTGNARKGSRKSPLLKEGGTVFGPKPRDYEFKLNKKVKQLARKSVLSAKAQDNKIIVLEDFSFETIKTKQYATMLKNLSLDQTKVLLVLPQPDRNILMSGRNLNKNNIITIGQLNTYHALNATYIVFLESALAALGQQFE